MLDLSWIANIESHATLFDEIKAPAESEEHIDVLIDHEQAYPGGGDLLDCPNEVKTHLRRQPECGFVKHEQSRATHEPRADRRHLPFAAAQCVAALMAALGETGKEREHLFNSFPATRPGAPSI